MRVSNWFPMSGDGDIDQHASLTNIPGPQESKRDIIYVLVNDGMVSDMHTINEDN